MLSPETVEKIVIDKSFERPLRCVSTKDLKAMWDSEDYDVFCDEIHAEMNARGEGSYVAV